MPNDKNRFMVSAAVTTAVAAFGTVFLLPALRSWSDTVLLWWLFYVIATAMSSGTGRLPITNWQRLVIAVIPALMPLFHIGLQVVVLQQTVGLSSLRSDNPNFWILVALLSLTTWLFVWLFSHARTVIAGGIAWLMSGASERKVNTISRVLTAILSLLGVLGILITKLMPPQ